jgi:transcriptional regulator with GAF, ATPase, and Fis domain
MSTAEPGPAHPFAYLALALSISGGTLTTLERIVRHAAELVPARWAVALVADRLTSTPPRRIATSDAGGVTDVIAEILGSLRTGPRWSAFETGTVCHAEDLRAETRFGQYPQNMLQRTPVQSVLALPLKGAAGVMGVLTLYGERAHSFGSDEVERAQAVASFAGVALAAAVAEDRAANLEIALSSSRTIGTAVGVLVERHRLTQEQAFDLLRQCSMHANRKLVDVARDLVECGELAHEATVIAHVLHTDSTQAAPA